MYYSKDFKKGELSFWFGIHSNCFALPLEITWHIQDYLKSFGVVFLCFGFLVEHWNWDDLHGADSIEDLKEKLNVQHK